MPRLPPVDISPQTRLRARFCPAVIDSVVTFFQSHSSSSATSWARPVSVPCPISERAIRITQVSSGFTTTQALTSVSVAVWASAAPMPTGRRIPSARPPPAAAVVTMKRRRESVMSRPLPGRGQVNRGPDALVGTTPADVRHRVVDVLVGRLCVALQECRRGHDLTGLAVAALRDIERRPRLLDGMRSIRRGALDRDDLVGRLHAADGQRAGAHQSTVEMHGAGAALRDTAAVLRARQPRLLADDPEQRC